MIRILVTGSRDWTDYTMFAREMIRYITEACPMGYDYQGRAVDYDTSDLLIVHGGAAGADRLAEEYAAVHYIKTEVHLPDYRRYGTGAPQRRNQQMVALGADVCLAFIRPCHYPPSRCKITFSHGSHGASRTARLAEEAGIETRRTTEGF